MSQQPAKTNYAHNFARVPVPEMGPRPVLVCVWCKMSAPGVIAAYLPRCLP